MLAAISGCREKTKAEEVSSQGKEYFMCLWGKAFYQKYSHSMWL
ncbi:hypothetical protein BN1224_Wien1_A_04530 [Chlamydia pneumoniae]|uniref:Uncharacterized protein n=1 Tax=Chlamydia pneumoniae TaxID=83558 RepID=A0A0F7XBT9_CHLPN|nr:hypothetical protein BN1224_Wien1_A_04530 [Chlamydia pneumoniae]CRI35809.1 hypothetical protein BN1224_CM1_A_04560 [Chlamydia pneumoniae]CRI38060.1 hypothetical protein BN1224_CV15_B_03830 [Chlamydia pneumoniae]CRI40326.1 hypothetical protein CWL029c_C_02860 [Chlamydia pneumoniae]CRI47053.1 hypothetical protein BN1224_Panola_F_01160 [Chlamydia pneumoniae]